MFPQNMKQQSYLNSTNQQIATHSNVPYQSLSNGRQGMELQTGNRNYDMMV